MAAGGWWTTGESHDFDECCSLTPCRSKDSGGAGLWNYPYSLSPMLQVT